MEGVLIVVIAWHGLCSLASVLLDPGGTVFSLRLIRAAMQITEVKIVPLDEGRLKGRVTITLDNCLLISEIKIIRSKKGYLVQMPQRRRRDGTYVEIAYPITLEERKILEEKILTAYELIVPEPVKRRL